MSAWPKPKTIASAVRGDVMEIRKILGVSMKCVGSIYPWIFYLPGEGVGCTRCQENDREPNPPASMAPGAPRTSLLAPGTEQHGLFLLTWLNAFSKKHAACSEVMNEATS